MRSFTPLAVSAVLLSSGVLASGSANDHGGRLQKRNGHGAAAPQWIKRRSSVQKRTGAIPLAPALLLTVSNATASAANATIPANTTTSVVPTPSYNGTALWFYETGTESACYTVHTDADFVVGLSTAFWPDSGVVSPYCGQYLAITDPETGTSVTALISDASGNNYTTLTRAAFSALAELVIGEIPITFTFLNATTNTTSNSTVASIPLLAVTTVLPTSTSVSSTALPASITSAPIVVAAAATSTSSSVDSASILAAEALAASISSDNSASSVAQQAAPSKASAKAAEQASQDASASSASQASVWAAEASASQASVASAQAQASQEAAAAKSSAASASAKASSEAAAASKSAAAAAAAAAASASAASSSSSSSSSSSQTYTGGVATYFTQNGVAGACGAVNLDSAKIIAIDSAMYDNGGNCGRSITITRTDNGATVTATVADECPTCENGTSLDLSEGAFLEIATYEEGEVNISWHFNN